MGTPLGPTYIPYTYMDPLGKLREPRRTFSARTVASPIRMGHSIYVHTLELGWVGEPVKKTIFQGLRNFAKPSNVVLSW